MSDDKELDLRSSIRNLKSVVKTLDATNFNFNLNAVKAFADKIDVETIEKRPLEEDLETLLEKFLRGERNFSRQELKNLPYIIYKPEITLNHVKEIWNAIDVHNKRQLSGVISVYLQKHDNSPKTDFLRQNLHSIKYDGFSQRLEKIFASKDKLFSNERFTNMAKIFAQKLSVNDSLETIGLSVFYKTSNFIGGVLKLFFHSNVASLSGQMKLLTELDAEYNTYKNIFPAIADALIQSVYRAGYFKEQCIKIFYGRLGDPRFGNKRFNWDSVSRKSQDIFCHWLSEEDLEVFFKIIKQTAVDRMWRYREKFWRAYLPYIVNTKIFLGSTARNVAARLEGINLNHGNLTGAIANQSVLVFQIGRYIFSEWSHNGMLRVHNVDSQINLFDTTENFFENDSISRNVLVANFIEAWVHSGSNTYFWQKKVSEWLKVNCGINKTEKDWGLKN